MAILVKDSFNRADSTNGLGQTETGQTWQTFGSVWGIQNNQAYPVNASLATLPFVVSPKTDNIVFQVKIAVYHWDVLIAYKIDNAGNTYLLERGRVYKNVNGAVTQLATIPVFKNDDVVKVRLLNNVHTIYINEAQVATFSDSAINGNRFGFSTYGSTTIRYDDFLIEDLSASESKSIQSDFSAKQVIHKQDTLDISIKSFIYKPTSLQIPTKQIICKQVITDFLTKQTVTTVLSHTIDFPTRQIIHKQSIGTLPTKQSIYIPTVSEHLTKQYMYISTQQDFRTKQALYKQFISDFSTKQNAFKQVMSDFAVQQIITAITNYIVDFATKQIIHKQSITDARIQQRVYKQVESIVLTKQGIFKQLVNDHKLVQLLFKSNILDAATEQKIYKRLDQDTPINTLIYKSIVADLPVILRFYSAEQNYDQEIHMVFYINREVTELVFEITTKVDDLEFEINREVEMTFTI